MLAVTANDDTKTYDGMPYSGGNGVAVTGWQYDDQTHAEDLLAGALAYGGAAQGATNAGTFGIAPTGYEPLNNYTFSYQPGTLLIQKAPLLITAENKQRLFGEANPVFTFLYEGFVSGEGEGDLVTLPAASTTADETSAPGDYPIVASGAASPNYEINYQEGTLTLLPLGTTFAFGPLPEKTYGDAPFDPGAVAGDDRTVQYESSNPEVAAIIAGGLIQITGAGTTQITASLPDKTGYETVEPVTRELFVRKALQTIVFNEIGSVSRDAGMISLPITTSSGQPVIISSSDLQVAIPAGGLQLDILRLGSSTITATLPGNENYLPAEPVSRVLSVVDPEGRLVKVHPAISPNGDGLNEFLLIEGIRDYPENRITIVNRNGIKVFELRGYDNTSRLFKGLSNVVTSYDFLPQGTYFYVLELKVGNEWKRETGWFVMKYSAN